MTKKRNTYILLATVLLVWGLVIYRLVVQVAPPAPSVPAPIEAGAKRPAPVSEPYAIQADYRDPFLGTLPVSLAAATAQASEKPIEAAPAPAQPPAIDWSAFVYTGVIRNPERGHTITLMNIQGTDVMLREGEHYAGAKLLQNKGDYIILSYEGQQKKIDKQ